MCLCKLWEPINTPVTNIILSALILGKESKGHNM